MVATETTNKYPHLKITELLDLIDLSKSTYYDWIKFKKPIDRYFDYDLLEAIRFCFETCGRKTYGAKRVAKHLKTHGLSAISAKKVLKYMKRDGLIPENYEPAVVDKTTIPERKGKYDRKLKAKMSAKQLNKYPLILSGDITEETLDNGHKVYTCAWIDIRTNKVYGLVTAEHKGNALLLKSLECLVDDLGNLPVNTLMHTDNGSEFKSYQYKLFAMALNVVLSMSRVGKSTDNGWIEGFWSIMKREALRKGYKSMSIDDYSYTLAQYVNFYNYERISLK